MIIQSRTITITCAECGMALSRITQRVPLKDVRYIDPFTIRAQCQNENIEILRELTEKMGVELNVLSVDPVKYAARQIMRRPILLAMTIILLWASIYLPTRILFVRVEGNSCIPERQILEAAEYCGITFGAKRSLVRSEQMKNNLLEKIPQLQWVGVNTSGCVATIKVREGSLFNEKPNNGKLVSSIVAVRDGVILQCQVTSGTALCHSGQAVTEGQILISGYNDLGLRVSATQAVGEVQALTKRSVNLICPFPTAIRDKSTIKKQYYSLRIGKKLINLQKDSGISGTSCAKIYAEEYACLPGGFRLPISLVRTTVIYYDVFEESGAAVADTQWVASAAQEYLRSQMISGEIVSSCDSVQNMSDGVFLQGTYICREMIGRIKYEESIYQYGEND